MVSLYRLSIGFMEMPCTDYLLVYGNAMHSSALLLVLSAAVAHIFSFQQDRSRWGHLTHLYGDMTKVISILYKSIPRLFICEE
jgi:hypothetical protein